MSLAALGAIAGGLNQGMDLAQRDQELKAQKDLRDKQQKALEEDREYMKTQRDLQASQTKRLLEKQARQDQYEADASKVFDPVSETSSGPAPSYDAALSGGVTQPTTTTRQPTQLEVSQRLLQAQKNAQMVDQAAATQDKINKIFTDVDRQNYNTLLQSSQGMSFDDLADRASQLVTADNSPLMVGDKQRNSDGSYTFNIRSRLNGASMPFTAKNSQDLLDGLRYHMDYEQYAAEAKARRELKNKLAEQRPAAVGANGALVPDGQGGWIKVPGTAAPNGQSTAAQSKTGADADEYKPYSDAFYKALESSADKGSLTAEQVAAGNRIVRQIAASSRAKNASTDPSVAGEIALSAIKNPDLVKPAFNKDTGTIDKVFPWQGNNYVIEPLGDPVNPMIDPKQMPKLASDYIATISPEDRSLIIPAAFNPNARRKLEDVIKAQVSSPEWAKAFQDRYARPPTKADIDSGIAAAMAPLQKRIELISRWGPQENSKLIQDALKKAGYASNGKDIPAASSSSVAPPDVRDRLKLSGGILPTDNSEASLWRQRRDQAKAEAQRKEEEKIGQQQALSRQFQIDKARMDPLSLAQKYDSKRGQLPVSDAAELQRIERSIR